MNFLDFTQPLDPRHAGGKAGNLARAARLGFLIPESRVVPRSALRGFLDLHRLAEPLEALLAAYPALPWPERNRRFEQFRAMAVALPIPPEMRSPLEPQLVEWLARAPAGLAVRSSAVGEDHEQASFAGIYESYLGITTLEDFWRSLKACWCASWSSRAAAYAARLGLELPLDGMAVLVQTLVLPESAGVLFTADPLTGDPWRFVINAGFGLAARLLDGAAPADRFVLTWDTAEILERRVAAKPSALRFENGHMQDAPLPQSQTRQPSLSDDQAQAVARLGLAVDRAFDRRMDIEWAWAGGQLYLLQARPLTALPVFFPHQLTPAEAAQTWTPYLNTYGTLNPREKLMAPFARERWLRELWTRHLEPGDVFPRVQFAERDFNGYRYATERKWRGSPATLAETEAWLEVHERRLRRDWLAQLERARGANEAAETAMQNAARAADWVRAVLALVSEERAMQAAVWYAPQWMIFTCEALLKGFLEEALPPERLEGLPAGLLQGLSCYSVERTAAAQALGEGAREDFVRAAFASLPLMEVVGALEDQHPGCDFLQAFTVFCRRFGMEPPRAGGEKNALMLDMEGLLVVIRASLLGRAGAPRAVTEVLAESAARRRAAEAGVRADLSQRNPGLLERFNRLLDWAQFWTPALDDRKYHCTLTTRLGPLIERAGQALAAEGLLDSPAHFRLLTVEEWSEYARGEDGEALRAHYRRSQQEYERNRRLEPPPYLGKAPEVSMPSSDPQTAAASTASAQPAGTGGAPQPARAVFTGEGIAPGCARGIACKVSSLEDPAYAERLTGQHILICGPDQLNAQWRRDWYSLFMVVRGLVTVQGAQLHHATQIARECGIPFLNLTEDVFDHLPDGIEIEVDAGQGTLRVIGAAG